MDERVFHEKGLILALLKRRFLGTALNNTGISSSDIGTVYEDAWERVKNWIDEAPLADVKPVVRGRWIEDDDGDGRHCSVCGADYCYIVCSCEEYVFCPMCGSYNGGDA